MTDTRIAVIAVVLLNIMQTGLPVIRISCMKTQDIRCHLIVFHCWIKVGQSLLNNHFSVINLISQTDSHRHKDTALNTIAVMSYR
ncbi:hypothetical protein SDC9_135167 [bioreactor metagenome]|uniref:Uncharacterized protein n=1 Tax=bioreactor metagenome TaxID=1076179 RepID=A0A645DFE3_9ZZZZ